MSEEITTANYADFGMLHTSINVLLNDITNKSNYDKISIDGLNYAQA